ncbi:unnamed protein product [Orchesella dallaii]|uniref:Uncharacterized protein n=1 Tax=Orchesella dallaii TaxID=48710 RepID=A0ABP1QQL0_9HEXA
MIQITMTMRFGSIIIHKPDRGSGTDSCSNSSDETEIAEIAETATLKYAKQSANRRSERQRNMANKSRKTNLSRSSSASSVESNELPILRMLAPDQTFPWFLSHYIPETDSILQEKVSVHNKPNVNTTKERGDRLGLHLLNSGSRPLHPSFQQKRVSSLTDAKSTVTAPFENKDVEDEGSSNGLSKFLKTLNISERLRQHKAEQDRLNIHNLPDHMREQLKHIYVY